MSGRPSAGDDAAALSIGALSAAVGIPVDTIRSWERRYGVPVAERKPSGHRVYPLSTVPHLRRIAEAIARGHRAAEVVPASEKALDALLASLPALPVQAGSRTTNATVATQADLLDAVRRFDTELLKRALQADWARLSAIEFLEGRVAPLLSQVGDAWAAGKLDVRHEHFASAVVGDFLRGLRSIRGQVDEITTGPIVALATLPGELHGLGLQMSALVFTLAGWRPLVLGVDTPVEQIAALCKEAPIAAVAVSCVQPLSRKNLELIKSLREQLPRKVKLLVGGAGADPAAGISGVEAMKDLSSLDSWLAQSRAG